MSALTLDTLVKVVDEDRSSMHGGTGTWTLGRWRSVTPPLDPCRHGLHVMTIAQAPLWLGPCIGLVEVAGERIDQADKVVVQRARITGWLTTWDERTARRYAADCAEHVLSIYESAHPGDERPRQAIEAARALARGGSVDPPAAAAARAAAWAGEAAAEAAAGSAAWSAARAAARAAAWAGEAAAGAAAGAAAWSAARAAARAAVWSAAESERRWQAERLLAYLRGEAGTEAAG